MSWFLKLAGWASLIFGVLVVIAGPFNKKNQPDPMTYAIVIFGLIMIGLGLLLIKL